MEFACTIEVQELIRRRLAYPDKDGVIRLRKLPDRLTIYPGDGETPGGVYYPSNLKLREVPDATADMLEARFQQLLAQAEDRTFDGVEKESNIVRGYN